jgi:hypothetical protein
MNLINRTTETVITDTFWVNYAGQTFIYKEYLNLEGKVIDAELRDEYGDSDHPPAFLEEIEEFISTLPAADLTKLT